LGLINFTFIWQSLKGRFHGKQRTKVGKSAFFVEKFSLSRCHSETDWNIGNGDGQLRSAMNVATLCANLVMIGGVTPEQRLLIFVLL